MSSTRPMIIRPTCHHVPDTELLTVMISSAVCFGGCANQKTFCLCPWSPAAVIQQALRGATAMMASMFRLFAGCVHCDVIVPLKMISVQIDPRCVDLTCLAVCQLPFSSSP